MNFLIYFCIPLVVTGQLSPETKDHKADLPYRVAGDPEVVSETGTYSKYEYGPHVAYKTPLSESEYYAVGREGTYYRKHILEDTGEVGKPSIYNSPGTPAIGNQEHPSFTASDVYNSIRNKKTNSQGLGTQGSPDISSHQSHASEPGLHDQQNVAYLAAHYEQQKLQPLYGVHSPVNPLLALQNPHHGQYLHSHLHSPLVPLYQSQIAPEGLIGYPSHSAYAEDGIVSEQLPVAQQVIPTLQAPTLPGISPFLLKSPLYQGAVLTVPGHPVYLKSGISPVYQTPHFKEIIDQHEPAFKEVSSPIQTPFLKNIPGAVLLKSPALPIQPGSIVDAAPAPLYHNVLTYPRYAPTVLKPVEAPHALKSAIAPILKTGPGLEASIVPAVEEHHKEFQSASYPAVLPLGLKYPKVQYEKSLFHRPAVFIEKAALKASLAPSYHSKDVHKAIFKAPLHKEFVNDGYLEPELPAKILSSQKAVVNALIASDHGKAEKGLHGRTHVELLPSLSYGFSYSLYPKLNGLYGEPEPDEHVKHHDEHHDIHYLDH